MEEHLNVDKKLFRKKVQGASVEQQFKMSNKYCKITREEDS